MRRLLFALLHSDGSYMLSRNFRLQRVGDLGWVLANYEIGRVSLGIDELVVLDVSPDATGRDRFRREVATLAEECFVPVTVGGHIRDLDEVGRLLAIGADKVLLNTPFHADPELCEAVAGRYGSQALVAGIDVSRDATAVGPSRQRTAVPAERLGAMVDRAIGHGAGEVLVQSVDRDGTGNGLDLGLLEMLGPIERPLIVMGGVGRADHLVEGLVHPDVDAVATANLFNFVGDSLVAARQRCVEQGVALATWRSEEFDTIRGALAGHGTTAIDRETP